MRAHGGCREVSAGPQEVLGGLCRPTGGARRSLWPHRGVLGDLCGPTGVPGGLSGSATTWLLLKERQPLQPRRPDPGSRSQAWEAPSTSSNGPLPPLVSLGARCSGITQSHVSKSPGHGQQKPWQSDVSQCLATSAVGLAAPKPRSPPPGQKEEACPLQGRQKANNCSIARPLCPQQLLRHWTKQREGLTLQERVQLDFQKDLRTCLDTRKHTHL